MSSSKNKNNKPISILSFTGNGDAYSKSLFQAIKANGAYITEGDFSLNWLWANHCNFNCVHINWPSLLYSNCNEGKLRNIKNFGRFIILVLFLRICGLKLYWTAHNLYPHEQNPLKILDKIARLFVIFVSRRIFVHGPTAAVVLAKEFPLSRNKLIIIDHGNWINFYLNNCSQEEARNKLSLDVNSFVFLFFGLCREYKNLHELLNDFKKLDGNVKLVIAGAFLDNKYFKNISEAVNKFPLGRIHFFPSFIPDDEIQYYFLASDAVVLPYTEILTSGAAILSLSFGKPVIAPRKGNLIDLVSENCGILYSTENNEKLLSAMKMAVHRKFDGTQILRRAAKLDWEATAARMLDEMNSGHVFS